MFSVRSSCFIRRSNSSFATRSPSARASVSMLARRDEIDFLHSLISLFASFSCSDVLTSTGRNLMISMTRSNSRTPRFPASESCWLCRSRIFLRTAGMQRRPRSRRLSISIRLCLDLNLAVFRDVLAWPG